ncbi:toxin-activating lysine-acyltransferase [Orbaceae bacterium ac157xtp]
MTDINFVSPQILGQHHSEAEYFGSATWLWLNSKYHRGVPLYTLSTLLLPAIKRQQFVLGFKDGNPVSYISWAQMSPEVEAKYLQNGQSLCLNDDDWQSGDQLWFIDIISPFGLNNSMANSFKKELFPNSVVKYLYHKNQTTCPKIKYFYGNNVKNTKLKNDVRELLKIKN